MLDTRNKRAAALLDPAGVIWPSGLPFDAQRRAWLIGQYHAAADATVVTGFIPVGELAELRADLETTFPATATRLVRTKIKDDRGGHVFTYSVVATYRCRLYQRRAITRDEEGRLMVTQTWECLLPAETELESTDRLIIGGVTWEIDSIHQPRAEDLATKCNLTRSP